MDRDAGVMLVPVLLLAHAAIAAVLLVGAALPAPARHRLVQGASVVGMIAAAAVYPIADRWRTLDLGEPQAKVAAIGVAVAWLLVLVGERRRGDWRIAAAVGVASSGLLIAAPNRWVVPLLVFGSIATCAVTVGLRDARASILARLAIVAGDVLIACGLVETALSSGTWMRPEGLDGWPLWAVVAGLLLRGGALPLTGLWGTLGTSATPMVALVVAGTFAIPLWSLNAEPWVAVALLAASLAVGAWTLLHRELRIGLVATWPVLFGLATAFASSRAEASAGIQAVLGCAAVALWPWTIGRAQVERGVLLAFLPLTAGFAAIALAASTAFEAATRVSGLWTFVPWVLVVGLLPLGLLAGVLLGARVGATPEEEAFEPSAVLAVWALVAAAAVLWLTAPHGVGEPRGEGAVLQIGAVVGAVAAGAMARGRPLPAVHEPARVPVAFRRTIVEVRRPATSRLVSNATLMLGLAGAAFVVWFTLDGLQSGFL
jgi:hypothetical protein